MTETRQLSIDGMTCNNCVRHVRNALSSVPGLDVDDVSIGSAVVRFDPATVTEEQVLAAIREAGYIPEVRTS